MFESVRNRTFSRNGRIVRRLVQSCQELLSERGDTSGASHATSTLELYAQLDAAGQAQFFDALLAEFSPDPAVLLNAAQAYAAEPSAAHLERLSIASEPPRQELLRRLNRATGGTRTILHMRERLLALIPEHRELEAVDWDFRHLLGSWFNPGFLQIVRVDWRTPAYVLEQIIEHDAVHAIRGWDDLRRRLESDRRCFAFFHPALPDEPLVFVEVALTDAMPASVQPLLDLAKTSRDPAKASTAVFYSINNCQPGLRGVSLGTFLIKSVVDMLSREFPRLRSFCTLSPIPGFARWLATQLQARHTMPRKIAAALDAVSGLPRSAAAFSLDVEHATAQHGPYEPALVALCATYLLQHGPAGEATLDPVARFHLYNGAKLERIDFLADTSKKGVRESLGLMVNYTYDPDTITANHDKFVRGEVVASRKVRSAALE